jgi:predicted DNA binding CopG/RHH family protein
MAKPMKRNKLPKTDSIEKLAKFWDTHDVTDFEQDLEEATDVVFERATSIKVVLQPKEAEAVQQIAQTKGVSQEELIHEWVQKKIARPNGRPSKKRSRHK